MGSSSSFAGLLGRVVFLCTVSKAGLRAQDDARAHTAMRASRPQVSWAQFLGTCHTDACLIATKPKDRARSALARPHVHIGRPKENARAAYAIRTATQVRRSQRKLGVKNKSGGAAERNGTRQHNYTAPARRAKLQRQATLTPAVLQKRYAPVKLWSSGVGAWSADEDRPNMPATSLR